MHNFLPTTFGLRYLKWVITFLLPVWFSLILSACGEQNQAYNLGIYLDSPSINSKVVGLKEGLKALGYSEDSNIRYQLLNPKEISPAQFPDKLKEFVAKDYPVYWVSSNRGAIQLKQAGLKKPIIVAGLTNPVQSGLIKNYYQPDTNLNGVDSLSTELTLNRLNLLLTFDPSIRKIYLLYDSTSQADVSYLETFRIETTKLGIALLEKPVAEKAASKSVLAGLKASEARAILTLGNAVFDEKLDLELLKLVVTNEKLILVGLDRFDLDFGALFSYGNDFKGVGRQSAAYIDRVFHGANIAKMPVLQPTQLELVLNQKIAIQIGYKFSNDEIATADESIN